MDGTDRVVAFIEGLSWDALPATVRRTTRMALLDVLGAAIVGTLAPVSRIAAECAAAVWPGREATLLLRGCRASAIGAAFANGYAANAIDIDDCAIYTRGHPGAQVFPAALALAEAQGLSGAEMLTGMVVGYEVAHRAARIWHATHDVYQACGSWGSVACAAVACRLLRIPAQQARHALGIAEYHAPNVPMMQGIDHPAMVKHGTGWGAMTGLVAAELASRGFTAIPSLFSGPAVQDWVGDIGQRYIMAEGLAWKRHACCAWDHAALKGAALLMERHGVRPGEIARVRVEAPHETVRLGVELPTTTEEAQFNLAWPLAALLITGEVGPAQILAPAFSDRRMRDMARRIEVVESEELNRLYRLSVRGDPRGKYASVVTFYLRDGTSLTSGVVEGDINYPQQSWDERAVEEKFRWLVRRVLPPEMADALIEMVRCFEELQDVRALTRLVV
jgi:2-methylcitrate dehydratase PrpD